MATNANDPADDQRPQQPEEQHGTPQQNAENEVGGIPKAPEKEEQDSKAKEDATSGQEKKDGPPGGYDSTPIPRPPPGTVGYTVKFTFHRATNLAMGDAHVLSSDPYVAAQLNTGLPKRHKEDPNLRFRSATIRRSIKPEWNEEWIVANVPSTGFKLKLRIYDEDPQDHDDMLGKVHIPVDSLNDNWSGIKNQPYRLTIRDASKRAQLIKAVATCFRMVQWGRGEVYVSMELLGRTQEDDQNGKAYTVGPCRWTRHHSPLLGRIAHVKDPSETPSQHSHDGKSEKKQIEHYNFQANQFQLAGPVPPELYHRFVEFKPWVDRMFTTKGFQGVILGKALHHQHARVYNFDRTTVWGHFPGPCVDMTKQFLDLVHHDQGGRIFTYVLTLDALWRFTETGKEFGVDMLSKHTMHSDVSIYIAFSGEFFIRRLKHPHRPRASESVSQVNVPDSAGRHELVESSEEDPPTDPSHYELIIDNDSGTYRPNAKMLPILARFLSQNLPGLHVKTLDSQGDAEKMTKMKEEQRERKKKEGQNIVYAQGDDSSSISSSEDERLNQIESHLDGEDPHAPHHVATGRGDGREVGHLNAVAKDVRQHQKARIAKIQRDYSDLRVGDAVEEGGAGASS